MIQSKMETPSMIVPARCKNTFAAINQAQRKRLQSGPAIRRHFQNEGSVFGFEDARFQNARRKHCGHEPKHIQTQHGRGWERQKITEHFRIRNESCNQQSINGNRAEQVISGAIKIVAMRSRLFSITRVAITAGTAHA